MKVLSELFFVILIYSYIDQGNEANAVDDLDASINTFPWVVSIQFQFFGDVEHVCGGVILSDIFVLTAASCFGAASNLSDLFSIRAGIDTTYHTQSAAEQIQPVSHIILHPYYESDKFLNNLALVRVSQAFDLESLSVSIIPLSNWTSLENLDLVTVGWNRQANQSDSSVPIILLRQTTVQEDIQCTANHSLDPKTQLCAIGENHLRSILAQ